MNINQPGKIKVLLYRLLLAFTITTLAGCAQQPSQTALQKQPSGAPGETVISIEDAPTLGDENATLTILEFVDYQCPQCARHARKALPGLIKDYVETGKVKYVIRDLPLETIHKDAFKAAEATHCAADQGQFWKMHDRLFVNNRALSIDDLKNHSRVLGLDQEEFSECLDNGNHADRIRNDIAEAQKVGARVTPTFFIGLTETGETTFISLKKLPGTVDYEIVWKYKLDRLLKSSSHKK